MSEEWKKIGEEIMRQREALGILPIHPLVEGENIVTIDLTKPPVKRVTQFGERYQIFLKDNTVLMLGLNSPLLTQLTRFILDAVSKGEKEMTVKIIRAGRGRATRYTVVKV